MLGHTCPPIVSEIARDRGAPIVHVPAFDDVEDENRALAHALLKVGIVC